LAEDAKLDLENNLSIKELVDAVQSINRGKAPGPDGLPVEIYKTFSKILMPHLLEMYTESYETGILPPLTKVSTNYSCVKTNYSCVKTGQIPNR